MTRRRFLQSVALLLVAASGYVWLRGRNALKLTVERLIDLAWNPNRRLRYHFSYLDLDPAAVDTFVQDYEHNLGRLSRFKPWPDDAYTRFLVSTDFFQNGADQSRRISYVSFYHPYVTRCYNPLARFDEPPA